ncbi:MAG: hypothetical protein F4147_12395 [Gammaproteobacteria bacterium]|nr:hypothetical protein [Gammaproteobacteria bacterium]
MHYVDIYRYTGKIKLNPERIIDTALKEFKNLGQTGVRSEIQWTSATLNSLYRIGRRFGCSVWVSSRFANEQDIDGGECVIWIKYDKSGFLESGPVVAECEWSNPGDVKDDYEKPLLARATVRVVVFDEGYCKNGAEAIANKICDWVGAYEGSQKGDKFLLVGYEGDDESWCFRYFIILVNESDQQPTITEL